MATKRATFYTTDDDDRCQEARKFIEELGVILDIRNIEKNPLTVDELKALYGYCDMSHFVNQLSDAYTANGLDKGFPERDELIELMAADFRLIRRPIIKSSRLMTVGYDKQRITEMLQLGQNGSGEREESRRTPKRKQVVSANTSR
jgi:arsenate reductase-like glutaredoxin family protein